MTNSDIARVFKAFCDENRLEIIELLKSGEMCANDILKSVNVVQSTLSHHMKILCESAVVNARKSGKMTYYSISADGIEKALELLANFKGAHTTANAAIKPAPTPEKKVDKTPSVDTAEADVEDNWSKMVTFID